MNSDIMGIMYDIPNEKMMNEDMGSTAYVLDNERVEWM